MLSWASLAFFSMATCPRCKGHLTENHRCPRRGSLVALEIVLSAIGGGLAALLLLALFDPRGQVTDLDTVTFVVGALVGVGINRLLRA
jgi:predicted membrane-bound spermidine synthase